MKSLGKIYKKYAIDKCTARKLARCLGYVAIGHSGLGILD